MLSSREKKKKKKKKELRCMNSRVKLTDFGLSKGSKDTGQHNEFI